VNIINNSLPSCTLEHSIAANFCRQNLPRSIKKCLQLVIYKIHEVTVGKYKKNTQHYAIRHRCDTGERYSSIYRVM